jgi:hypothetical protein
MLATLVPVVIGGAIALAGTWLGPWISERHKEGKRKGKRVHSSSRSWWRPSTIDHWLDKERDANLGGDYVAQGVSPFAKLEAISAVYFAQFDRLIRELDFAADRCVIWMIDKRVKRITGALGDNPLDDFPVVIEPYNETRNKLLKALREFAHKEFQ